MESNISQNRIIINPYDKDGPWHGNANNKKSMLNNLWSKLDKPMKQKILNKTYQNTDKLFSDLIDDYKPTSRNRASVLARITRSKHGINGSRRGLDKYSEITTFDNYVNDAELAELMAEVAELLPESYGNEETAPNKRKRETSASHPRKKGGNNRRTKKRRNIRYNK